jgi:phosphoribosylformimino-5-aminoimidazole carboxamide ribotide isomerase
MLIIPAIDLQQGRCVRLYQGNMQQPTVYSDDPLATARRWEAAGASWLHVVDLDGAQQGHPVHLSVLAAIAHGTSLQVQASGGLRSVQDIEAALGAGARRVVLGTVAVRQPELVRAACLRFGEAIVVGLDARAGRIATHGWTEQSDIPVVELAQCMVEAGASRLVFTDIGRDGTLTEPNYAALAALIQSVPVPVIASGGVARLEHLLRLHEVGAEAAIVGKALYTGDVDLAAAVAALSSPGPAPQRT